MLKSYVITQWHNIKKSGQVDQQKNSDENQYAPNHLILDYRKQAKFTRVMKNMDGKK